MKKLFLSVALLFPALFFAQNIWNDVAEPAIPLLGERRIVPRLYRTVKFDLSALQPLLAAAPLRFSPAAVGNTLTIELPTPDGRTSRFLLTESPVMKPGLQAQNPDTRCYTGKGIDDPGAMLKCDLSPQGFHALVLHGKGGDWLIDPYSFGDTEHCTVYFKKDYPRPAGETWQCQVEKMKDKPETGPLPDFQGDCKMREYDLALACTGEYAAFHGGTVPSARSAMITSLNRVNGVYELEFAVTMVLVDDNDDLIFLNAATDPYTNDDGFAMLDENQATCDDLIGNANYDIGHVFSTGGGGVAGSGVVCIAGAKAWGVTGLGAPVGDAFDIDYVAHEIGHQFDCDHTFNGTEANCGGGNRVLSSAYEPGSGSTIMGYAGICGSEDIQPHSDAYFHARSLRQAGLFVTGGGHACDSETITGNAAPTANAGADYTIPKSTPFVLTATGSDPDGDPITYCWEQYDNGDSVQPPDGTDTNGPNFRSFEAVSVPERYFPALAEVIDNNSPTWEVLSSVSRTMNFRITVRDNFAGAGCTKEDNMVITVATSGPFKVTIPNTPLSWAANSTQTVTWNVAGSDAGAVNCDDVKIWLSTDGGLTYPTVILASTPNDGTQSITVPNNQSITCRIKISGVGNVFYDISDEDFIISAPSPVEFLAFNARLQGKNNALLTWATASEKDNKGFEIQQAVKTGKGSLRFEALGFVEGHGTSAQRNDYRFEAKDLVAGEHYFRLRQMDFDGGEEYSPTKTLAVRSDFFVKTLPNPVQNELEVQVFQEKTATLGISILNQWGQETELLSPREVASGDTQWRFSLADLPAGAYYLVCRREGQNQEERKLLLKR
ncbi:MAG: reprolysin-like metallopeptidase [Saprospiraceae bacterium]